MSIRFSGILESLYSPSRGEISRGLRYPVSKSAKPNLCDFHGFEISFVWFVVSKVQLP